MLDSLQVWLDLPNAPKGVDEAVQRYGVIRHGNLGYTAAELRGGAHLRRVCGQGAAKRRADGASLRAATTR